MQPKGRAFFALGALTVLPMRRVAIFGNTGGGKSTLAKRLAELVRLPLYPIDLIQFKAGGGRVPHDEYLKRSGTAAPRRVDH